jgi:hypothetical protein
MKGMKLFFMGLLALVVAVTACGGGGGGGGVAPAPAPGPVVGPVEGTTFDVVDLPGLDAAGTFSAGIAVNNNGTVVGVSDDGLGILGARWNLATPATIPVSLNPLGGDAYSAAYGLNDAGIAVGESGNASIVAVYWPAGSQIPTALSPNGIAPGADSAAYGINALNEIVGEAGDGAGSTVAIFWASPTADPVELNDLSVNPGSSAYFISNGGTIVGESRNASGQFQAVAWVPTGAGLYGNPVPLEALVDQFASVAFGMDAGGRIVGEAELNTGVVHGVVWNTSGAVVTELGANTSAQAVSQGAGTDRIAGYTAALSGSDQAAVWNLADTADNQNVDDALSQAYGINDFSDIVGVSGNQAFAAIPQ